MVRAEIHFVDHDPFSIPSFDVAMRVVASAGVRPRSILAAFLGRLEPRLPRYQAGDFEPVEPRDAIATLLQTAARMPALRPSNHSQIADLFDQSGTTTAYSNFHQREPPFYDISAEPGNTVTARAWAFVVVRTTGIGLAEVLSDVAAEC